MPFNTTFSSNRCIGYKIQLTKEKPMIQFSGRKPVIALLVNDEEVTINQPDNSIQIGITEEEFG